MAIINRFQRLFTADLNAVMDRLEEPSVLLKHAVREMEEAHEDNGLTVRQIDCELEHCESLNVEINDRIAGLSEQLDLCFDNGEEALAKQLVKRKLELDRRLVTLEGDTKALCQRREVLAQEMLENQEHLHNMRQKLELLVKNESIGTPTAFDSAVGEVGRDEIEAAFLQEKQRRAQA